jgi:hypothetical protein
VAPGAYLGTENHLRITVGYPSEKVKSALHRISKAVSELGQLVGATTKPVQPQRTLRSQRKINTKGSPQRPQDGAEKKIK